MNLQTAPGKSSVGTGGDGTSLLWSPLKLGPRLLAWWKPFDYPSFANGGIVSGMTDRSGKGRNISGPTNETIVSPGLNGKSILRWNGFDSFMQTNFSGLNVPMHIVSVIKKRGAPAGTFFDGATLNSNRFNDDGTGIGFFQGVDAINDSVGNWMLNEAFCNGATTSFLRRDRNVWNTTGAAVNTNASGGFTIGCAGNQLDFCDMDLAEMMLIDCTGAYASTGLVGLPLQQLRKYLNSEWGV